MSEWQALRRFLDKHGTLIREGKKHLQYLYVCGDGAVKIIICSKSSKGMSKSKWQKILRRELKITQEEFNAGL